LDLSFIFLIFVAGYSINVMAFLKIDKKKKGTYLRIVKSLRVNGKSTHKTLYSLGKVEDYPADQLEKIAKKLLELAGVKMEDIVAKSFHETNRLNYGYALVIKKLWKLFDMDRLAKFINSKSKVKFDWINVLQLMLAERINEPCSKLQNYFHQQEYLGFNTQSKQLHHFYRTLDLLSTHQDKIKKHLFTQQQNLFTQELDVVFYDVTTLYFESMEEQDDNIRQKGYSKDGKANKTQVVLGLLVDKMRNPISYEIYRGNTYEGSTMLDALKKLKANYSINKCIVVADSAMIDKSNRALITKNKMEYIIGERLKNLPKQVKEELINKANHKQINPKTPKEIFSYTEINYQDRRIICTFSEKRAKKDLYNRQKLIDKAKKWIENPSQYNQVKKRGAGRFIKTDKTGTAKEIDQEQIEKDAIYDGFKAIATTTKLDVNEILSKYSDLYEVEHSFRALKTELEIRPMYHWTNKRIEGHIAMCFIAYTMLNHLRNTTKLQYREIVKALDKMQMSEIKEDDNEEFVYMRSNKDEIQEKIAKHLKIVLPNDIISQKAINQLFI